MKDKEVLEALESWLVTGINDVKATKTLESELSSIRSDEYKRLQSKEETLRMVLGKLKELQKV
jgi:hypothetical protein